MSRASPQGCALRRSTATPAAAFGVARSFSGRRWRLRDGGRGAVRALHARGRISPVLARLLARAASTPDDVADYLNPTLKQLAARSADR